MGIMPHVILEKKEYEFDGITVAKNEKHLLWRVLFTIVPVLGTE